MNAAYMKNYPKTFFILLIIALFLFRVIYGLVSEFWFEDDLQIYLIGLKYYTSHSLSYCGPDVIYTHTQIPGALQEILVGAGFFLLPLPETPTLVLNILSFLSLSFFAFYISKRISVLPKWLIWVWVMTLSWTMDYSTRIVNPSYVIIFSIPFFICLLELLPVYKTSIVPKKISYFVIGAMPFLIMQLHLSFVLLFPFIFIVFFFEIKKSISIQEKLLNVFIFIFGALIALISVIPAWFINSPRKNVSSNIVFNVDNYKEIITVLLRYLSFATYEIPNILGGRNETRFKIINSHIWMAPFTLYLFLFGSFLVVVFIYVFFKYKTNTEWRKIKYLTLFGYIILFLSFFFSIKGPASHTFYLLLPLPVIYSFYCYEWLWVKFKGWKILMYTAIFSSIFFYTGLGLYNYKHYSLYYNREKIVKAIQMKDYKILGLRRTDWKDY